MGEMKIIKNNKNEVVKTIPNFGLREGEKEIARFGTDYDAPKISTDDGYGFQMSKFLEYSMILTNRELHIRKFINDDVTDINIPVGDIDVIYENSTCFVSDINKCDVKKNPYYKLYGYIRILPISIFLAIMMFFIAVSSIGFSELELLVMAVFLVLSFLILFITFFILPFLWTKIPSLNNYMYNKYILDYPLHYKAKCVNATIRTRSSNVISTVLIADKYGVNKFKTFIDNVIELNK